MQELPRNKFELIIFLISVNDINDNSPIFDEKLVERNVTESIKIGAEVARVQAQDKDEGDNGTVFYQYDS